MIYEKFFKDVQLPYVATYYHTSKYHMFRVGRIVAGELFLVEKKVKDISCLPDGKDLIDILDSKITAKIPK